MRAILLSVVVALAGASVGLANAPAAQKEPAPAPQADPLPTVEQVQKLLQTGDGAEALKQVNRLLSLRGKSSDAYDKYDLLTLKGDAHLRLKAPEAAATAYRQASGETDERQKKALARATEQLIRRSRNLAYTPRKVAKGDKVEPIDIVEPDSRRKALAALFVDEVTPLLPKIEAAKDSKSIGAMIKAMATAKDMEYLELAANGSSDQINGIVEGVKAQAKSLLTKVVEKATKRVDRITEQANDTERVRQVVPLGVGGGYRSIVIEKRRGVQHEDVGELKSIIDACDEVAAQAKAFAQATASDESEVEDLIDSAQDLKVHVQRMLRVHNIEYKGRQTDKDS